MHNISIRQLTNRERKAIKARSTFSFESFLFLVMLVVGPIWTGWLIGSGIEWLVSKIRYDISPYAAYTCTGIAICCVVLLGVFFFYNAEFSGSIETKDLKYGRAEVIHVKDPIVFQQEESGDEGSILYFDIGEGKILFVCGQWLWDSHTYGAEHLNLTDEKSDRLNCLPDPYGFPSDEFIITCALQSRTVLGIEVKGNYLAPSKTLGHKEIAIPPLGECEILSGSLDNLQKAVGNY